MNYQFYVMSLFQLVLGVLSHNFTFFIFLSNKYDFLCHKYDLSKPFYFCVSFQTYMTFYLLWNTKGELLKNVQDALFHSYNWQGGSAHFIFQLLIYDILAQSID